MKNRYFKDGEKKYIGDKRLPFKNPDQISLLITGADIELPIEVWIYLGIGRGKNHGLKKEKGHER